MTFELEERRITVTGSDYLAMQYVEGQYTHWDRNRGRKRLLRRILNVLTGR